MPTLELDGASPGRIGTESVLENEPAGCVAEDPGPLYRGARAELTPDALLEPGLDVAATLAMKTGDG